MRHATGGAQSVPLLPVGCRLSQIAGDRFPAIKMRMPLRFDWMNAAMVRRRQWVRFPPEARQQLNIHGSLAQLETAPPYEGDDSRFESEEGHGYE